MSIVHAGYFKPRIYVYNYDVTPANVDRLQSFTGSPTLPVDQLYEIGRYDKLCSQKRPPEVPISQEQFEYGSLEYYLKLAGKSSGDTVELEDFDDTFFDFVGYEGMSETDFRSSILFPKARLNGFGLNLAGPEDIIKRSFDFTADSKIIFQNDNKYWVYKRFIVESGNVASGNISNFTVDDPDPVQDPDTTKYFHRILRIRGGVATLLDSTDYTFTPGTGNLAVNNSQIADVIKVYYTSSIYIIGQEYHTLNDVDDCAYRAYNASIYLIDGVSSNYVHMLTSLSLGVSFDRQDVKELGNKNTQETGIRTRDVTISTTGFDKNYTFQEILRGVEGTNYGKIDIEKFKDTLAIVVKIYDNSDKDTFKIGYQTTGLAVESLEKGVPVNDFVTKNLTLKSDNLKITTDESSLLI